MRIVFGLILLMGLTGCHSTMTTAVDTGASEQASSAMGCKSSGACKVQIAWDASESSEDVSGYLIEYGRYSRTDIGFKNYEYSRQVAKVTEVELLNLEKNKYFITIRAINGGDFSDRSEEVAVSPSLLRY